MGEIRFTWEDPYALIMMVLWYEVRDARNKESMGRLCPSLAADADTLRTYGKAFLERHLGVDVVSTLCKNAAPFKNIDSLDAFKLALDEQVAPLVLILDKIPLED
jgi:hypothetical protein